MTLFDLAEAERRKEEGMARAASARRELLAVAQGIAQELAQRHGCVHADDVAMEMHLRGSSWEALGNAAGSVFRGMEWTGDVRQSLRPSTHGRIIRVWRLA
jgi:hypothetical protein